MFSASGLLGLLTLSSWFTFSRAAITKEPSDGVRSIPLRTHSLATPYLDSDMASRWWDFGGDTLIRADQYVRLTSDVPSQSGWVFSKIPLTATNWEIEFEFSITGKGNLHGDGFAMWVTKDRAQPGNVFGHRDLFDGFGLFFDTYKNNRPGVVFPYVMGMIGDGRTVYDAANDGKANEIGGCSARGLRGASVPSKAKVTYFQDQSLDVKLQYKTTDQWTDCFRVEAGDGKPFTMPPTAYLGFSAHTGELSDNFDIISVETKNLYQSSSSTKNDRPLRGGTSYSNNFAKQKTSGTWGGFFLKVFLVIGIAAAGFGGFKYYQKRQRDSRKYNLL